MSAQLIFTIFYLLITFGIVYPPEEFISAGFTIGNWFRKLLGSEDEQFICYHIKKSMLNLFVYSCLPIIYVASLYLLGFVDEISSLLIGASISWQIFATFSIVAPLLALLEIHRWSTNNFQNHPIVRNVTKFCDNTSWEAVAAGIENEYRRLEIVTVKTNPMTKTVITENWIIKVTPLNMFLAHQSDATVKLLEVNTFELSHLNANLTEFYNLEVESPRVGPFIIRINGRDFWNLTEKLSRGMNQVLPVGGFTKSITEQFMEVFRETVIENPRYSTNMELDHCFGCLQARPSIKIQKQCPDEGTHPIEQKCTDCSCRPMWCLDCLAKWFVSRQDKDEQNRWLSKKCTCPMCRATFCVLDVCLLEQPQE